MYEKCCYIDDYLMHFVTQPLENVWTHIRIHLVWLKTPLKWLANRRISSHKKNKKKKKTKKKQKKKQQKKTTKKTKKKKKPKKKKPFFKAVPLLQFLAVRAHVISYGAFVLSLFVVPGEGFAS